MNSELPEKNFIDFVKSNSRIFTYAITTLILIAIASSWFMHTSKKQKIKISEDFIKAQVLLSSKNENRAKEILKD